MQHQVIYHLLCCKSTKGNGLQYGLQSHAKHVVETVLQKLLNSTWFNKSSHGLNIIKISEGRTLSPPTRLPRRYFHIHWMCFHIDLNS